MKCINNKKIQLFILFFLVIMNSCAQNAIEKHQKNSKKTKDMTEKDWKEKLTEEQYYIIREKGTERPFTGKLLMNKEKGIYKCAACGAELFTDEMKFDSHCGWPSFDKEIAGGKIKQTIDNSLGRERIEITCASCDGHLGHIFDDGPTETGQRYCVNSVSLEFVPENQKEEQITLAGGCFWCIEAVFDDLKGVIKAESGYSGGKKENPTYKEVCSEETGHAEVVHITYIPSQIKLEEILEVFFTVHDPTQLNRQGNDIGTQYRSAIFYHTENQKKIAGKVIVDLTKEMVFSNKIVTEILPFKKFYKAEDYHQQYFELNGENPYCQSVVKPKYEKFRKIFKDKLKK